MKKRRLYVLSVDAMITEDLEFLKTLPAFGRVLKNAAVVSNVISVYPSLTYPAHATMLTGCHPDRHHVINNEILEPNMVKMPWYRSVSVFDDDVKTVLGEAKKAGYTTAAICWPVTSDIDVDYHLPETWVWSDDNEAMYQEFIRLGAKKEFLNEFWEDYGRSVRGLHEPYFSLVTHGAALAAIRNHKAEVVFEHLSAVDHTRHSYGVYAKQVFHNAYLVLDLMLQQTLDAMEEAGVLEDTTIVITSDHGQTPVTKLISLNYLLAKDGFITLSDEGKVESFRAFAHSAAHSTQIYLSDPSDAELESQVLALLQYYQQTEPVGFARIFTRSEVAQAYHIDGSFSFMIEGEEGVSFSNSVAAPLITYADNSDYKYSVATHGHLPDSGPKPVMFLNGPGIVNNAKVDGADLTDEAPTLAALLGVSLGRPDGRVLTEVLA